MLLQREELIDPIRKEFEGNMRILILLPQLGFILGIAACVCRLSHQVVNLSVGLPPPELVFSTLSDKIFST